MIGEKHIPEDNFGKCSMGSMSTAGVPAQMVDCSWLGTSNWYREQVAAKDFVYWDLGNVRHEIVKDKNYGATSAPASYGFGSYHPGVCLFALGDGAILPGVITTSPRILCYLSHTNDGVNASLLD